MAHEVVDGSVTLIKNAVCGCVIDLDRLLLGAEEGLFCIDLDNCGKSRLCEVVFSPYCTSENVLSAP